MKMRPEETYDLFLDEDSRWIASLVLNGRADGASAYIEWKQTLRSIRALPEVKQA